MTFVTWYVIDFRAHWLFSIVFILVHRDTYEILKLKCPCLWKTGPDYKKFFFLKFNVSLNCLLFIAGPEVCTMSKFGIRSIVSTLPAWFRFAQCLRRYRDTKMAFPHLVNAGKYSTTFFVVLFSGLYSSTLGKIIFQYMNKMKLGYTSMWQKIVNSNYQKLLSLCTNYYFSFIQRIK